MPIRNPTGSTSGPEPGPSHAPSIPSDLSFFIKFTPLKPDYRIQGPQAHFHTQGHFLPPDIAGAFEPGDTPESLLLWKSGTVTEVATNDTLLNDDPSRHHHSSATMFTQEPDTPHLLVVNSDARDSEVVDYPRRWRVISFEHRPYDTLSTYSFVDVLGAERRLAALGSTCWIPQLLPSLYDYQDVDIQCRPIIPNTQSAGLIGSLPLLLALAAFSAPPNVLTQALQFSLQPGRWQPHSYNCGRRLAERGMVVTIYCDPSNPIGSTRSRLDLLQDGEFGPFYR